MRIGNPPRLSGVARSGNPGQNPRTLHNLSWGRLGCNLLLAACCLVQATIVNLAGACARCGVSAFLSLLSWLPTLGPCCTLLCQWRGLPLWFCMALLFKRQWSRPTPGFRFALLCR